MINLIKNKYVLLVLVCVLSFLGGMYIAPRNEIIKTQVEIQKDIEIVERIVELPNGEKVTERVTRDTSKTKSNSEKSTTYKKPQYGIWAMKDLYRDDKWTIGVDKRLFSNISVGAYGSSDGVLGLSVRIEF